MRYKIGYTLGRIVGRLGGDSLILLANIVISLQGLLMSLQDHYIALHKLALTKLTFSLWLRIWVCWLGLVGVKSLVWSPYTLYKILRSIQVRT